MVIVEGEDQQNLVCYAQNLVPSSTCTSNRSKNFKLVSEFVPATSGEYTEVAGETGVDVGDC